MRLWAPAPVWLLCLCSVVQLGCTRDTQSTRRPADEGRLVVAGEPVCDGCQIVFQEVVRLGGPSDPASVRSDAALIGCMVGAMSTGEWIMSGPVGGGELFVYGQDGRLQRTIGRRGQGPVEFGTRTRLTVGPGDTLYVVDDQQGRLQVLTASGEYVRSFQIPSRGRDFARLSNGDFVFHGEPLGEGDPLFYVLDPLGSERTHFGKVTMERPSDEAWTVSPAQRQGFWTGSTWRYDMFLQSAVGSVERSLTREVDWFPPFSGREPEGIYQTVPPPPFLLHIWEDELDRLWTYVLVPDPEWEPAIPVMPDVASWARRTFDMVTEVLDLQNGQVIARGRGERLGRVCGSRLMYDVVEGPDGSTFVQVLEPILIEASD